MDVFELQSKEPPASEMIKDVPNCSHSLPATGFKDFQPSNSLAETKQIEDALKQQAAMLAVAKVDKLSFLIAAEWNADRKLALVTRRASGHFDVIGHEENARLWLYAEEILLLLELSRAELWYGGVSMSIQQGYAMLLGDETGCRDIEYAVYKHLSLLGYRILRHKMCPTQYELDIRLEQCSAKSARRLLEEKNITCVDRMPATLMEDDPAEARTDSPSHDEIVLPLPSQFPAGQVETIERSISRCSSSKESSAPGEDIVDEKFPSEFVVLDEWTAADEHNASTNDSASIVIDEDKEIIGVTLEAKEIADEICEDRIVSPQKSPSDLLVVDSVVKPPSPKYLAEICPQICIEPAVDVPESHCDKVSSNTGSNSPEIIPTEKTENNEVKINKPEENIDADEPCIFSDLNSFLAEICPSPKRQEDISPLSSHTESDFIGVSGIDASETVLNSLAEVNAYDVVEDTDDENYSDDDEYRKLMPGFNVVVRQNMCPVLVDVPEPVEKTTPKKDASEIQMHGKRHAETTEEAGSSKRLRTSSEQELVGKEPCTVPDSVNSLPDLEIAGNSKEPLVNGEGADEESDSDSASTASIVEEGTQDVHDGVSASESSSEDEDCLNIESNRDELESPVLVEEEDSDLEIIEMSSVEDLEITISNKRKQMDDDVRNVKRRPVIEVINLSDEETESEESDDETEDLNQAEERSPDETDALSISSSTASVEETQPNRPKFWSPALLEDEDRTKILKSIVNAANKTQVDLMVDWRYIPSNCVPAEKRIKVFRLNAIGIGGKPSVDYIPAHKVIEARENAAEFVPLAEPPPSIPPLLGVQPPTYPPPLGGYPTQQMNPWVQVGPRNFLPNYQLTVNNPFHRPPPQWHQPSSAFIAPNNMGYAIPGSFAPPRHVAPLLHVVHTPRMRNRTIRGVTKVVRPHAYDAPVCNRPQGQGWFQQNNVFSEPNAIRVELPPPVKPDPWRPGVMQKMKDEVPRTVTATLPSRAVKEEGSEVPLTLASSSTAKDDTAVGGYTVTKILSCCEHVSRKQRARLRFEWKKMVDLKQVLASTHTVLAMFEKKTPLLKGLTRNMYNAWGDSSGKEANSYQPRTGVKVETQLAIPETPEQIAKEVAKMFKICPPLKSLNLVQIANLKMGIYMKASGMEMLKAHRKTLLHAGQLMGNYVKTLLQKKSGTGVSLHKINALIACVKVVSVLGTVPSSDTLEILRDRCLRERKAQIDPVPAPGTNVLSKVLEELSFDERVLNEAVAREDTFGIVDLKTLIAKIKEWVIFTRPTTIAWNFTKTKLQNKEDLNFNDYSVLYIAQSNEPRLCYVLPLIINKTYMVLPNKKVNGADGNWQAKVKNMVKICPWLNTLGPAKLRTIGRALKSKALGKYCSQLQENLLNYVNELITRTVKYIVRSTKKQSAEVNYLIACANYLKFSGENLEFSNLLSESRNKGEILVQQSSPSNVISGGAEIPENTECSADENRKGFEEGVEETSSKAPSESSVVVDLSEDVASASIPNDTALPERIKEINAQVVDIIAWLTLSEEQNEIWKRTKERMANGETFIAEDLELFRFAASKDERFSKIEHLIDIGRVASDLNAVGEDALQEMEVEKEAQENSCQSTSSEEEVVEPLIKPSDCTDYASVISKLGIIRSAELTSNGTLFKISYDLYLPVTANSAPFRKSNPGKPDYRIVVLRPEDPIPGASEVSSLGKRFPDRVPVLFAIVRAGTVSFLRLDAVQLPADLTEYGHQAAS